MSDSTDVRFAQAMLCSSADFQQQQKANLARIRDNQRRSRARRKEYLQELEAKYRSCEAVGVEASAEIQSAARKVLDENRRLRQLLLQHGYNDAQIDAVSMNNAQQDVTAADSLEAMLGTRKACGSGCGPGSSDADGDSSSSRRWSCGPSIATQLQDSDLATGQPIKLQRDDSDAEPMAHISPSHQPVPEVSTMPVQYSSPFDPYAMQSYAQPPPMMNDYSQWQPAHQPGPVMSQMNHSPGPVMNHSPAPSMNQMNHSPYPQNSGHMGMQQFYPDPSSSSCQSAATIIHTLNPQSRREDLEGALGCSGGRDCAVDNAVVFEVMDRFSV